MKVIPRKELVEILSNAVNVLLTKEDMARFFEKYGDDYFSETSWSAPSLCKENEERKKLLKTCN